MFLVDRLIFVTGVLLLLGIASSKLSARIGLPVLVLFLLVGMLAGSEGIGGIPFENYSLAHGIGTVALVIILFDGGLGTSVASIRSVWKPAIVLATAGVFITALLTGLAAAWLLEIPLLVGMLLGSIVGSTDAAAVFAVLRSGGVSLGKRLAATLEVESASNDPMAIFLTIGCLEVLTGKMALGPGLLWLFASQMFVGTVVGLAIGFAAVWVVNRINLETAGLYPVLVGSFGLLSFGLAAWLGGSGFLAAYVSGVVIGNQRLVFQRGNRLFIDAGAWLSQILMFVVLGLLSFPSRLLEAAPRGLLIGFVLIFVARPIAILLTMFPFRMNWREQLFLSWVGLKGAVPITLATFPLLYGLPRAGLIFDLVFFVVVLSAVVQGWTLPMVARWLGLEVPPEPTPPITLEISSLRNVEGDVVDYTVGENSRAAGKRVKDLALPEGAVIALIARGQQVIPPSGRTEILAGDHVILVLRPGITPLVSQVFASQGTVPGPLPTLLEFPLRPNVTVQELEEVYGVQMNASPTSTLAEAIRQQTNGEPLTTATIVRFGPIALHIRELSTRGEIERIGMIILPTEEDDSKPENPDSRGPL